MLAIQTPDSTFLGTYMRDLLDYVQYNAKSEMESFVIPNDNLSPQQH